LNVLLALTGVGAATVACWSVAVRAARRRRLPLGTLPAALPVLAAVCGGIAAREGAPPAMLAALAGVGVAAVVDARTGSIFDPLTLSVLVAALALRLCDGTLLDGLRGALAAGGCLWALYALTRRRGIGFGDVKLGAALGSALGPESGVTALALAFIAGGCYGGWLLATRRATRKNPIRFAPFIAAGTLGALALRTASP
jgi:leader peptidase (prepilin peptidase)/N-methyltransferase